MKQILAAIDFSPVTGRLVETALRLAGAFDGQVRLVHVAAPDPDFVGYEPGPQTVRDSRARQLREEHVRLQELARTAAATGRKVDALLVQGQTADELLAQAVKWPADAIVMGSCGHTLLRKAMLGSISAGVLKRAPCPVVVVPSHLSGGADE
jgi:nucleotide-binding universal stress UspA family protein